MPSAEAARVEDAFDGFGTRKDSGSCELVLFRNLNDFLHAFGAKLGRDGCGFGKVAGRKVRSIVAGGFS